MCMYMFVRVYCDTAATAVLLLLLLLQALESEAAWSRFVRNGRVQLRCEVTDCE